MLMKQMVYNYKFLEPLHLLHWRLTKSRVYPGIYRRLTALREESKLARHTWQDLLVQRLRKLLLFAHDQVPYYRGVFEQVDFDPRTAVLPEDLNRVPILIKDLVRENVFKLISKTADRSRMFKNSTGGSTGVPLSFYQDQEYMTTFYALDAYVREQYGIKPYDRTASVWGADREFHELSFRERFYNWRHRSRSIDAFRMSEEKLYRFCRMLLNWKPPYLKGYSSALEALAKFAKKQQIRNLKFKAISSSAEVLWPQQRELIEQTFKSPVYNFYGSREVSDLAAECPEERRLHVISSWRYIEIVDDKGQPVPYGKPGYIIVTDLSNFSMPFVRYRNEDIGKMAAEPCPCGRPSPVIEEILGRSTDLIHTPQGDIVHGEFFTHLFYGCNDILQFQVHQTDLDHLVLRYVPVDQPPQEFINEVVRKIRKRIGDGMKVDVELCDAIPIPPSGKHRFTISDVKVDM